MLTCNLCLSVACAACIIPGGKSQGIKQLMAGGGVVLIGTTLIPLLSGLFG